MPASREVDSGLCCREEKVRPLIQVEREREREGCMYRRYTCISMYRYCRSFVCGKRDSG